MNNSKKTTTTTQPSSKWKMRVKIVLLVLQISVGIYRDQYQALLKSREAFRVSPHQKNICTSTTLSRMIAFTQGHPRALIFNLVVRAELNFHEFRFSCQRDCSAPLLVRNGCSLSYAPWVRSSTAHTQWLNCWTKRDFDMIVQSR